MHKYHLEFILNMFDDSPEVLKDSLIEFGEDIKIVPLVRDEPQKGKDFKIRIWAKDPRIIFDTCAQFGRLKAVKID